MVQSSWLQWHGVPGSDDAESGHERWVTEGPSIWDPERLIHRQTYIDLIRAYLRDNGSQHDLAQALGLSEAYASYMLAPLRLGDDRPQVLLHHIGRTYDRRHICMRRARSPVAFCVD
jgi:hypothetical protein